MKGNRFGVLKKGSKRRLRGKREAFCYSQSSLRQILWYVVGKKGKGKASNEARRKETTSRSTVF